MATLHITSSPSKVYIPTTFDDDKLTELFKEGPADYVQLLDELGDLLESLSRKNIKRHASVESIESAELAVKGIAEKIVTKLTVDGTLPCTTFMMGEGTERILAEPLDNFVIKDEDHLFLHFGTWMPDGRRTTKKPFPYVCLYIQQQQDKAPPFGDTPKQWINDIDEEIDYRLSLLQDNITPGIIHYPTRYNIYFPFA